MSKVKISSSNIYRVLLTEVLPFEVPLYFSSVGFYSQASSGVCENPRLSHIFDGKPYSIPYDYEIRVSGDKFRKLTIVHPAWQLKVCDIYKKYDDLIIYLCSRSEFSLRRPDKISSHCKILDGYFLGQMTDNDIVHDLGEGIFSSYYFVNHKYSHLYKFYSSPEFLDLQKRFRNIQIFDIAKCFYNIYTHSIEWAVKDKFFVKRHLRFHEGTSFSSDFDKVMRGANFDETNGIVVGPEVSRIFSEIIFQRIDVDVKEELARQGLLPGRDYQVRRYIDDHFIFSHSEKIGDVITSLYRKSYEGYKLYVNESKGGKHTSPYITPESAAKIDISSAFLEYLSGLGVSKCLSMGEGDSYKIDIRSGASRVRAGFHRTSKFINEVQKVLLFSRAEQRKVSGTILSKIRKILSGLYRNYRSEVDIDQGCTNALVSVVLSFLEAAFYFYVMDPRVNSSYQIAKICRVSCDLAVYMKGDSSRRVRKYISDQIHLCIERHLADRGVNVVEISNMLSILMVLGEPFWPDVSLINRIYRQKANDCGFDMDIGYFEIVQIVLVSRDRPEFSGWRYLAYRAAHSLFDCDAPLGRSELALLYLDLCSCPYFSKREKIPFIREVRKRHGASFSDTDCYAELAALNNGKGWFIDWDFRKNFDLLLQKRELSLSY